MSARRKALVLPHPKRFTPAISAALKRHEADRKMVDTWIAWRAVEIERLPECYERSKLESGQEVTWLYASLHHGNASFNTVLSAWCRGATWATEARVERAVAEFGKLAAEGFSRVPDLRIATWLEPKGGKVIPIGRKRVKP